MPEQMRPASKEKAPDPATTYERSDPKKECGQGRLDTNANATPTPSPDHLPQSVGNSKSAENQLNSEEAATLSRQHKEHAGEGESLGWEKPAKH